MVMKSNVSVIIPSFNAEASIGNCLNALETQSIKPMEVIVVDGGSEDGTKDIARKMNARVFVEKKRGPAAARNLGVKKARGDIILFTDADCIPERMWVENMEREIAKRGIVGGAVESCSDDIFSRADDISMFSYNSPRMPSRPLKLLVTANFGVKREIFMKVGGFDESLVTSEDTDLSMRIDSMGYRSYFLSCATVKHVHSRSGLRSLITRHYKAGMMGGGINRVRYDDSHSSYRFFPRSPYMLLAFSPILAVASSLLCTARSSRWRMSDMLLMPFVAVGKFFWLLGAFRGMRTFKKGGV